MLQRLYNELLEFDLKHHELGELTDEMIYIAAKSLDPEGINEVMHIKKIADRSYLGMKWDGQNIEIVKNK